MSKKDQEEQEVTLSRQEFMRAYAKSLNLSYQGFDGLVRSFASADVEALYQSLQRHTLPLQFNNLTDFAAKVKN